MEVSLTSQVVAKESHLVCVCSVVIVITMVMFVISTIITKPKKTLTLLHGTRENPGF